MSLNNDYIVAKFVKQRIADLHAEAEGARLAALVRNNRRRRRAHPRPASVGAEFPSVDDLATSGDRPAASDFAVRECCRGLAEPDRLRHRVPS